eukprot:s1638_g10.t1
MIQIGLLMKCVLSWPTATSVGPVQRMSNGPLQDRRSAAIFAPLKVRTILHVWRGCGSMTRIATRNMTRASLPSHNH